MKSNLLTNAQAAAYLGLKPNTLEVWRCSQKKPAIPYCKVGRLVRYTEDDLAEYIAGQRIV